LDQEDRKCTTGFGVETFSFFRERGVNGYDTPTTEIEVGENVGYCSSVGVTNSDVIKGLRNVGVNVIVDVLSDS
jgi:hypothetical protein